MDFFDVLSLLGGLGLFLFGMNEMGTSLESLSASKFEKKLEKLTSNSFKSIILGAIVTALIQSSSATTVIIVGLVNSGILKFYNSIGVILGANIGTTITSQILSLSGIENSNLFVRLLNPKSFTPALAFIGIVLLMTSKKKKMNTIGRSLLGLSILFNGMFIMEGAVHGLKDSPILRQLFISFENPILGIIVGALVTAIIQSSSASIGILQALSSTGQVTFASAFPIVMGQNIGTCITPILSSIGTNKNAKRSAIIHLYFNVIGALIFTLVIYIIKFTVGIDIWNNIIYKNGIANFHTIFNVSVTLLFLPFIKYLAKLAEITIRSNTDEDKEDIQDVPYLDDILLNTPSIAINQVKNSLNYMSLLSTKNIYSAIDLINTFDQKKISKIKERETIINKLEVSVSNYLVKLTNNDLTEEESKEITSMLQLIIDFERIGDYANSISKAAVDKNDLQINFSKNAQKELLVISEALKEIVHITNEAYKNQDETLAKTVEPIEETIDLIKETLRYRHMERLKSSECDIEHGIIFLEMITDMERAADHCSSIAFSIIAKNKKYEWFDRHRYKHSLHEGKKEFFNQKYEEYKEKYYNSL